MDISYYRKVNNTYKSKSKQETELWLLNRNEERWLYDNIDKQDVLLNGEPFELLVIKGTSDSNKKIKSLKSTPFNLGDYVNWNNTMWLVTSLDSDDKVHHSGTMTLCTYLLSWQQPNGTIISRWAAMSDASKYDEGTIANGALQVPTGSIGITLPVDNATKRLKRDMRFVIDITTDVEYADGVIPEVYVLSSRKTAFNNNQYFNRGGTIGLIMTADSFDPMKDKYITYTDPTGNTKSVWVCDYEEPGIQPEPSPTYPNLTASIEGSTECYFEDLCYWDVVFHDEDGRTLSVDEVPTDWVCKITYLDGTIIKDLNKTDFEVELYVDDATLLGETLLLQIILDDTVLATKKIEILGGF